LAEKDVVIEASDQDVVDAHGPGDDQRLAEHLGGVAPVSLPGDHAVADVATIGSQVVVEAVADRHSTDEVTVHGGEERSRDRSAATVPGHR
jgi:hypothetical protein